MKITSLAARTAIATALLAITGASIAATPGYGSRQDRMDAAYENYRRGVTGDPSRSADVGAPRDDLRATGNIREDARRFGRGMKRGAKHTGHAIADGARDAGHAAADGARDVGHAVADGSRKAGRTVREAGRDVKDKVTGKD